MLCRPGFAGREKEQVAAAMVDIAIILASGPTINLYGVLGTVSRSLSEATTALARGKV